MANDKSIRIKAVIDNSEFDQSLKQIEQKLSQFRNQQSQMQRGMSTTQPGSKTQSFMQGILGDFNRESLQNLRQAYQQNESERNKVEQSIKNRQQEIIKITALERESNKSAQDRLKNEQELLKVEQERYRFLMQQKGVVAGAIKGYKDTAYPSKEMADVPSTGGASGGQPQTQSQMLGGFKKLLTAVSAAAIMQGGIDAYRYFTERDRKITGERAGAATIAGKEFRELTQGRGSDQMFWLNERQQAMAMAQKEMGRRGGLDAIQALARGFGGAAAGGLAGTVVGGPLGGIAGAIGGGLGGLMGNERTTARVFDQERYGAMQTQDAMKNYEKNLAALQAMDQKRTIAREAWNQDWRKMYDIQRSLGVGGREVMGGTENTNEIIQKQKMPFFSPLMQTQMASGRAIDRNRSKAGTIVNTFAPTGEPMWANQQAPNLGEMFGQEKVTPLMDSQRREEQSSGWLQEQRNLAAMSNEDIQKTMGDILSGGGTTQAAKQLTGRAGQINQNMMQNNAGQVMGMLTGGGIQTGQATDVYKKIMAEAVKMGVDASSMPREMERFTQMSAEMVSRTGIDASSLISNMMPAPTKLGMESGLSAFQAISGRVSAGAGLEGQIGWAAIQGDKNLSQMDYRDQNLLNQLPPERMTADDPTVMAMANKYGIDAQDLLGSIRKVAGKKATRTSDEEAAAKNFKSDVLRLGGPSKAFEAFKSGGDKGIQSSMLELMSRESAYSGQTYKTPTEQMSAALGIAGFTTGTAWEGAGKEQIGAVAGAMGTKPTGPMFAEKQAEVEGAKVRQDLMRQYGTDFEIAAKSVNQASLEFATAFGKFKDMVKEGGDLLEAYNQHLKNLQKEMNTKDLLNTNPVGK